MYKTIKLRKRAALLALFLILSILSVPHAIASEERYQDTCPNLYADAVQTERLPPAGKTVYLTFDDGPSEVTAEILDALKKENVKATFFVIGRTGQKDIELLKRIRAEGHTIGVHSYSHKYDEIYRSVDAYLADFSKIEEWIFSLTGEHPSIFRFPGGSNNRHAGKAVINSIADEMTRRGYLYYDWNVIAHDDQKTVYSSEELYRNVIQSAKGKLSRNLTVLFHDNSTRHTTAEALPAVIQYFRENGYQFEAITPATPPIQFYKPKIKK